MVDILLENLRNNMKLILCAMLSIAVLFIVFAPKKEKLSDYQRGYNWAKSTFESGTPVSEIEAYAYNVFDFTAFDRGALDYLRTVPSEEENG